MSDAAVICDNPVCKISEDGRCVEGIEPVTSCPHYGRPLEADGDAIPSDSNEVVDSRPAVNDGLELPEAGFLKRDAASQACGYFPARVVAIIGAFDSGKTSLVAGLFDLFQVDRVAQYAFAGSWTLAAFEIACHDSRVASGRIEPHSPRTPHGEVEFFHLELLDPTGTQLISMLLGNRAGEEYEDVAGDISLADGLFELQFATTIAILVDGARLTSSKDRHNALLDPISIIQGLSDAGALSGGKQLAVVLTKHDEVLRSARSERAMADFNGLVDRIKATFGESFAAVESFITAASPKGPEAERGEGIPRLLTFWAKQPAVEAIEEMAGLRLRAFAKLGEVGE